MMARNSRKLTSTLRLAFLVLLLTTVALSWFCYDTFNRHEDWVGRFAAANAVLDDYQTIARLTPLEINALNDRLEGGEPYGSTDEWKLNNEELRETVNRLRRVITPGVGSNRKAGQSESRETLFEIGRTVEELIGASALINQALDDRRIDDANNEWERLKHSGMPRDLAMLIDNAIEDQELEIHSVGRQTRISAGNIPGLLPGLILVVTTISVMLSWAGFRGLARSVHALHEGARAFTSGALEHRIPKLKAVELSHLVEAFNTMAAELTDHRKRLQDTVAKLESTIEDRTQALNVSNQKLAEVDATRQKLLSNISHEFRTPLTVIRGQADIVLRGGSKTGEEYREAIERILRQASHAAELMDDLLLMARVDAGEPRLKLDSVSVVRLIDSLCQEFEATARQRNLTIEQHTRAKNAIMHGDAKRLWQVFATLLDNALRYSNPGGTVEVSVSLSNKEVQIEFRDYGIGLTEKDMELAFDRFYRGERAQEHSSGTGLGLSVAKAIVEAHNGSISLTGELGAGATAKVTFPLVNSFMGVA